VTTRRPHLRFAVPSVVLAALLVVPGVAQAAAVAIWHQGSLGTDGQTMIDTSHSSPPNDGTATDVVVTAAGFHGYAYKFNGTSSNVSVADAPTLNPGTSPISMTLHVKFRRRPGSGEYDLITKGASTEPYYKAEIGPRGKAACAFKGTRSEAVVRGAVALNDRAWHTIVCSKTSQVISVTVDGTTRSNNVRVGGITNAAGLSVGATAAGGSYYRGSMDEVTIRIG
jgi:Concanavalin A-like lectin/glucanases superfamily